MKPITLRLCAFGSYGSEQVVDFSVPQQNLFLVTGDTGAGKTTIFDAIVYALYGSVSSSDKSKTSEKLFSQFAEKTVTPYVELVFEENGEEYKVRREPKHYTYRKNGTRNSTMKSETVTLTMPDSSDYPGKEGEINKKLEELVGLTKVQFMQVAMIAQGEFMEVLRKTSDEKREIFRKIFNTDIYSRIIEETKTRFDVKKNRVNKLLDECRAQVKMSNIPMDYEEYTSMTSHLKKLIEDENFSMAALDEYLEELGVLCNCLESKSNEADKAYAEANNHYIKLSNELAAAREINKHFDTLEQAKNALKLCEERKSEIDDLRKTIENIAKAYRIKVVGDKYEVAVNSLSNEEAALKKNESSLPELDSAYALATESMNKAKATKEKADSEYAATKERVEKALRAFDDIDAAKENCERLTKTVDQKKRKADNAKTLIDELSSRENELKMKQAELKGADVKLSEEESRKKQFVDVRGLRDKLLDITDEISKLEDNHKIVQEEYVKWNTKAVESELELSAKKEIFYAAQAGILASKLKDNCECPVCGSKNHPNPCKLSEDESVSEDVIKRLEVIVKDNEKCRENTSKELAALSKELEGKRELFVSIKESLIEKFNQLSDSKFEKDASFDDVEPEVVNLEKALDSAYLKALSNSNDLKKINSELEGIIFKKQDALEGKEAADKDLSDVIAKLAAANENYNTLNSGLDFKSSEEANKALANSEALRKKSNDFYNDSEKSFNSSKTLKDQCEANIKTFKERIPGLTDEVKSCEKAYKATLKTEKLTEDEWKNLVDEYNQDTSDMADEVKAYDEEVSKNKALIESSTKAVDGRSKIDTEDIQSKVNDAKEKVDTASKDKDTASEIYRTNRSIIENIKPVIAKHEKAITEYNTVSTVYEYLAGRVKGGSKMDIETYAQRAYLERILDAANDRFEDMSGGQYRLSLVDIEKTSEGRKNNGLDLLVHSNVTNQDREVVTLSGGEKFMAALSLALGMADEIQAASSAVNLDIMFIDEGFGTLDTKSRNEAVKVLKSMAGGDKLIGIISHVEELKRDVDDLLVVTKTEHGSRVNWNS